jgi:hypothetical protein
MTMNEKIKADFLRQFPCPATRAYAAKLYDLEQESIATHNNKASDRVLEIVDFYDEIDTAELERLGIELID